MPRSVFATLFFLLSLCVGCFAQSNERIDELLGQEQAEFGHSLYVLLSAGGFIEDHSSVAAAHSRYAELGWLLSNKPVDAPLSVRELSYVIMKSLGLRGGIMYTILPSPRYAYRELVYKRIISGQTAAERKVSGDEVLRYLGAVLRMQEAQ
jgi:hypothetical protein